MGAGNKGSIKEQIGTILLDVYGSVPVYYIGGSAFIIEVPGAEEPMKLPKDAIDRLIKDKQIHISSPAQYANIIAKIDPITGATPTHNADGTKRSMSSQTLMMLENEGFLSPSSPEPAHFQIDERLADDGILQDEDFDMAPPPRRRPSAEKDAELTNMSQPVPVQHDTPDKPNEPQSNDIPTRTKHAKSDLPTDEFGRQPVESSRVFEAEEREKARQERHSAFTSWMQKRVNESNEGRSGENDLDEKITGTHPGVNKPFVLIAIVVVVVCGLLFFGTYMLLSGGIGTAPSGQSQNPDASRTSQNQNQATYGSGLATTYTRTDFDPEASVQNYKDASQDKHEIAIGFFKTLKSYYLGGDETAVGKLVALDAIGDQLANSYTSLTQTKQGLSEEEAATLRSEYGTSFVESEKKHIQNRDSDASIFCGRVRDVKVDGSNDTIIYVVMESVAGDHQRACFMLQSDSEQKSWALTQMVNPSGYISMIMEGPYNNDYTYGVESGMAAENAS